MIAILKSASRSICFLLAVAQFGWSQDHEHMGKVEHLGRGTVAVPSKDGTMITWRLLRDDAEACSFHVYQRVGGEVRRLTDSPITGATNFEWIVSETNTQSVELDAKAKFEYAVLPTHVVENADFSEAKIGEFSNWSPFWTNGYWDIPVKAVETKEKETPYRFGDSSVADLDGDGEYEIILHQSSAARDNSFAGITGRPILDAYKLDGTHMWRIDLGINIRDGEHYTQFIVYDFDGDGKAELACKTADGTIDGLGQVIGDPTKDYRNVEQSSLKFGRVLEGPEKLTIFRGTDGAAMCTVDYEPGRDPIDGWGGIGGNGGNDNYGNRCDRFLACAAHLGGENPSLVMARGVYGRIVLVAWDWNGNELARRWVFDSGVSMPPFEDASPYSGMGGHSLSVADVDLDGKDEIVYQAMVVDDDGKGLHTSGLRHGDAIHITDIDPNHPGLEIFTVQENEEETVRFRTPGAAMRDAVTGEILWSHSPAVDIGQGLVADIDPTHVGLEAWSNPGGLYSADGKKIGESPGAIGFAIWWDGDRLRELVGRGGILKWNWETKREDLVQRLDAGRFRNPILVADILGDWREEIIVPDPDRRQMRIYTTNIPTTHRMTTLMHDRQYRLSIAWQNVVYNKPPNVSFYFAGDDAEPTPLRKDLSSTNGAP